MQTLNPETVSLLISPYIVYILLALAIALFGGISVFVLSGFSFHRSFRHRKTLLMILLIALVMPFLFTRMYEQAAIPTRAEQRVEVQYLRIQKLNQTTTLVSFSTSLPALVYAEYMDNSTHAVSPVFQENKTDNKVLHVFVIRNIAAERGSVIFIINGTRYLYQGKPLEI